MNDPTDRIIRPPWTPEQVAALNAFQQRGGTHPFTCGGDHTPGSPVLVAREDGWHCSDPYREGCDYRQDWAHAFMVERGRAAAPAGPAPATGRAAVLLEAADELGRMDYDTDSNDYGYDTYRDAWNGGVMDGAALLRRLAGEAQQEREPESGCAHCGGDHSWDDCEEYTALVAREAQQDPTQDGTAVVDRRETVEYFVQAQQPDGPWEQCSSTATDREFATERVAARRRMQPGFTYRIAERTTTVVVRAVTEPTASARSGQPEADLETQP